MPRSASLLGLFLLRTEGTTGSPEGAAAHAGSPPDAGLVMARIEGELYALAFSDRGRADAAQQTLGISDARLFYVCAANRDGVVGELRGAGARGFIVDYDPTRATFTSAGALSAA